MTTNPCPTSQQLLPVRATLLDAQAEAAADPTIEQLYLNRRAAATPTQIPHCRHPTPCPAAGAGRDAPGDPEWVYFSRSIDSGPSETTWAGQIN